MKKNIYCVIMAGGIGSRFWPLSREEKPKQFVDVLGVGRTFIQMTYDRFSEFISKENFLVVTGEVYKDLVLEQLPDIKPEQILTEPCRRNTAPCIAYAMYKLQQLDPDAIAIVTPSDHYIANTDRFLDIINECLEFAENHDALLTVGITPTYPATGYGYIHTDNNSERNNNIYKVLHFKEKPDINTATQYLSDGNYYWNSGIFVWSVSYIINSFEIYLPQIATLFNPKAIDYGKYNEQKNVDMAFNNSPIISIDYGIMEKSSNVYVRYVDDLGWSDVGSWWALYSIMEKDIDENVVSGTKSNLYHSGSNLIKETNPNKKVIIDSLSGYMIADTKDVLMICPLQDENRIKEVIEKVNGKDKI